MRRRRRGYDQVVLLISNLAIIPVSPVRWISGRPGDGSPAPGIEERAQKPLRRMLICRKMWAHG